MIREIDEAFARRFWLNVDRSGGPDVCWPGSGSGCASGYRHMWCVMGGRRVCIEVHRITSMLVNGTIAYGAKILHRCNIKRCAHPAHLKPVTARKKALLDVLTVRTISAPQTVAVLSARLSGALEAEIAGKYCVSLRIVRSVTRAESWRFATGLPQRRGPQPRGVQLALPMEGASL